MKAPEIHAMHDPEIVEAIRDARENAFNLRLRHSTGELEDTSQLGQSRRELARLMTIANERGLDVESELRALKKKK